MSALPKVVFVLGGPGAGKGTQCARIVKEYGYVHLSAGDLLRAERTKGGSLGTMIADYIKEGKIIPVEVTIRLINEAMEANMKEGRSQFLVDGFPRNEDNLEGWDKMMTGKVDFRFVLFLECGEQVMQARLLGRNEGRADDNADSIRKRFKTYIDSTRPIIARFEKLGQVRQIDAARSPEEVWALVSPLFSSPEPAAAAPISALPSNSALDPVKKAFNTTLSAKVRAINQGDEEAGAAADSKKKPQQFWELPVSQQEELLVQAVQATIFNPTAAQEDTSKVTWKVEKAVFTSISGGYHVYAVEVKTSGATVEHNCRVNAYGVLERYHSPTRPNMNAPDGGAGCVVC